MFKGSGVALVTPFDYNLKINYSKLEELIYFHINNSTDAIILCGTTGESATITDEEFKELVEFTVKKVNKKIPVIVGSGSNDTNHAIKRSKIANKLGADGLLIVTPYYNKCSEEGLYLHYKKINDEVNIPIILYNVPSRTGVDISIDNLVKLSKLKNICGLKEAKSDLTKISNEINLLPKEFNIYSGNDDLTLPILCLGGSGVISVLANIFPKQMHKLCNDIFNSKLDAARKIHYEYLNLMKILFLEVNPTPIKEAMNLLGYNVGSFRPPLTNMSKQNLEILKQALNKNPEN